MDLVITVVEKGRSFLASVLEPVTKRVLDAMEDTQEAKITEIPLILDYSKERGKNKLRTRRTILGYFKTVLKLKRLQRTFVCARKEQMPWLT